MSKDKRRKFRQMIDMINDRSVNRVVDPASMRRNGRWRLFKYALKRGFISVSRSGRRRCRKTVWK